MPNCFLDVRSVLYLLPHQHLAVSPLTVMNFEAVIPADLAVTEMPVVAGAHAVVDLRVWQECVCWGGDWVEVELSQ